MAKDILTASQFYDYGHIVGALLSEIQQVMLVDLQTHEQICERMEALKAAGVPNYSLYWLNDYLYLAHPKTASRPRHRTYVGPKPELIEREYAAIKRKKQYKQLKLERKAIECRAHRVTRALTTIINVTKGQI